MKILCDVCSAAEAAVFCCADEAALCASCDRRVHHANNLAEKHSRFSLLSPSAAAAAASRHPLCDICQERRGIVFCLEDRAILCYECDSPIHDANHLTMKHSRFLLTGTRLSAAPVPASTSLLDITRFPSSSPNSGEDILCSSAFKATAAKESSVPLPMAVNCSSSISEYLTKTLPGYRVEDLLVADSIKAGGHALHESDELLPLVEADLDVAPDMHLWVPDVPQNHPVGSLFRPASVSCSVVGDLGEGFERKEAGGAHNLLAAAVARRGQEDWMEDMFTVPQLSSVPESAVRAPCRPSSWYF